MKKFRILSFILMIVLISAMFSVSALAVEEPDVSAQAAIVMDVDTGEVYYEKNADMQVQPASTTKMMTALLVVEAIEAEEISLYDNVTASETCQYNMDEESSTADPVIEPGEIMSVENLLYCAMLQSANEACNILAEYVSGSVNAFINRMNERAEELGCTGTHFANANGLENSGHYTTARDFALIAQEAVSHTLFVKVCSTQTHTVPDTNMNESRTLVNTNALLNTESSYYYEPAYGVKTGYFSDAGYCLVSAATYNDINLVCVVMNSSESGGQFEDTLTLFQWVYDNYSYQQILSSTQSLIDSIEVEMGTTDSTGVRAEESISVVLPNDYEMANINYLITLYHTVEGTTLEAPISAGEVLGEVTVVEVDENDNIIQTFGTSKLVATSAVEMSRSRYIRSQVREIFQTPIVRRLITVIIILLAAYVLLVIFYAVQRSRHLRSLRKAKRDRAERMTKEEIKWLDVPEEVRGEPQIDYFSGDEVLPSGSVTFTKETLGHRSASEKKEKSNRQSVSGRQEKSDRHSASDRKEKSDEQKKAKNNETDADILDDEFFDSLFRR